MHSHKHLQLALRTWFADPMSVPVYLAIATGSLLLALAAEPAQIGWTLFVVYVVLSLVAVRAQRTASRP